MSSSSTKRWVLRPAAAIVLVPALLAGAALAGGCRIICDPSEPGCELNQTRRDGGTDDNTAVDVIMRTGLTYYRDIAPILQVCQRCHVPGGIAPFPLTNYNEVFEKRQQIVIATGERIMPPWLAARGCREYEDDFSLTDQQIADIASWVSDGAEEGDPKDAPPPPLEREPFVPDLEISMRKPYMPDQTAQYDYRCFVLSSVEQDQMVVGFNMEPGAPNMVHHSVVFLVPPELAQENDDDDPNGDGYDCYGVPPVPFEFGQRLSYLIGGWAPGFPPLRMPEGTGIYVPAGSRLVLQIHYTPPNAPGVADTSKIELQFAPPGADLIEAQAVPLVPPLDPKTGEPRLFVAAGDPAGVVNADLVAPIDFMIYGTIPHMHARGRELDMSVVGSGKEECLMKIRNWNPDWQAAYQFKEPVTVRAGDVIRQECLFDNSEAGQPYGPDGKKLPVTDVVWGSGLYNEMCVSVSYISQL